MCSDFGNSCFFGIRSVLFFLSCMLLYLTYWLAIRLGCTTGTENLIPKTKDSKHGDNKIEWHRTGPSRIG